MDKFLSFVFLSKNVNLQPPSVTLQPLSVTLSPPSNTLQLPSNRHWLPFQCRPIVCLNPELATRRPSWFFFISVKKRPDPPTLTRRSTAAVACARGRHAPQPTAAGPELMALDGPPPAVRALVKYRHPAIL